MTDEQKIARIKTLLGDDAEATTTVVTEYLAIAKSDVLLARYPYGIPETVTDVPAQYEDTECILAARYFARRGGLGEVTHNENGVNRTWYSSDDRDIISKIIPIAKVVG